MKSSLAPLALLCFISLSLSVNAQNTNHQIGLNATEFTRQLLSFGGGTGLAGSPYYFTYKYVPGKFALRAGVGGAYSQSESDDTGNGSLKATAASATTRLGAELQIELTDRWMTYLGLDALYELSQEKVTFDSGFDRVTSSTDVTGLGGGPVMGVQFNLNDRLSLQTETAFYTLSTTTKNADKFNSMPEFNQKSKSTGLTASFILPTSIFFIVRF